MKRIKILTVVLFCFSIVSLSAQPASPMNEGTNGLFGNDTDNVTSTTGWSSVKFDKFLLTGAYGYMTVAQNQGASVVMERHVLNGAGMFQLGDITFGLSYQGALGGNLSTAMSFTTTETVRTNSVEEITTVPLFHNVRLLTGIPIGDLKLGIRAGVDIGGSVGEKTITAKTLQDLMQYTKSDGLSYKPQLSAGISLPVNDITLTPTIDLSMSSVNSIRLAQRDNPGFHLGPVEAKDGSVYEAIQEGRTYKPAVTLGLNVGLPSNDENFSWNSKISYGFNTTIQPEKYNYTYAYDGVSKQYTESRTTYRPDNSMSHALGFNIVAARTVSPSLTIKGKAQLDMSYTKALEGGTIKIDGVGNQDQTIKTDNISVIPIVSMAANVKLSEMVNWYTGLVCIPVQYNFEKMHQYDETGIVSGKEEIKTVEHEIYYPIVSQFGTGLQVTPAEDLTISFGLLFGTASEQIKLSTINDILSNANIRLGLIWKGVSEK